MKSTRAPSPHLPHGGTIPIREQENQRFGFIVDGDIGEALKLAFVPDRRFGEVQIAHSETPFGIGITVAKRSRDSAFGYEDAEDRTVEALEQFNVRQIISLSHRILVAPASSDFSEHGSPADALTFGVQPFGACKRLMTATVDLANANGFVQGVFIRDENSVSDAALASEGQVARSRGFCVTLIEATTFRTDAETRGSEEALSQILRAIPDAVSPLTSCLYHTTRVAESEERAG